jgi:hypothetical protein
MEAAFNNGSVKRWQQPYKIRWGNRTEKSNSGGANLKVIAMFSIYTDLIRSVFRCLVISQHTMVGLSPPEM